MSDKNPEHPDNVSGAKPPSPYGDAGGPDVTPPSLPEPPTPSPAPAQPSCAPEAPEKKPAPPVLEAPQTEKKTGLSPLIVGGIVLVGFLVAALIFSLLGRVLNAQRAEKARASLAAKPAPKMVIEEVPVEEEEVVENIAAVVKVKREMPKLLLGGIIYSENEGSAALINGRVVPEGGTVKGVKVVRVLQDKVELEFDGRRIFMRSL